MSTSLLHLFKTAVHHLNLLLGCIEIRPEGPSSSPSAAQLALLSGINSRIWLTPASPGVEWQDLICKHQMPRQLAAVTCRLVTALQPSAPYVLLVMDTLTTWFIKAIEGLTDLPPAASNKMCQAMAEQFEQTEILQLLPAVLLHTARHIASMTGGAAKSAPEAPDNLAATAPWTADMAAAEMSKLLQSPVHGTVVAYDQIGRFIRGLNIMQGLWPALQFYTDVTPAAGIPACRLVLAVLQDLSLWVQRIPAVYGTANSVPEVLLDAAQALLTGAMHLADDLMTSYGRMYVTHASTLQAITKHHLQSLEFMQVVALLLLLAADMSLLSKPARQWTTACSSSSKRRNRSTKRHSSSNSSGTAGHAQVLSIALAQHAALLPPAQLQLLQNLGSNGPFAAWASLVLRDTISDLQLHSWTSAYEVWMAFRQHLQLWPHQDVKQRDFEARLHRLMPVALLSWAVCRPDSSAAHHPDNRVQPLSMLYLALSTSVQELRREWCDTPGEFEGQSMQDLPGLSYFEHHVRQAAANPSKQDPRNDDVAVVLIADLLALLLRALPWLLQQLQQRMQLPPAARAAAARKAMAGNAECVDELTKCVEYTLQVISFLSAGSIETPIDALRLYGPTGFQAAVAGWAQHSPALCRLLDSFVRINTATDPNSPWSRFTTSVLPMFYMSMHHITVGPLLQPALASRPCSPQQTQLFSLLCSQLKMNVVLDPPHLAQAEEVRVSVALAAAAMLHRLTAASVTEGDSGIAVLPWLVLLGRCCLQWARQLQLQAGTAPGHGRAEVAVGRLIVVRMYGLGSSRDVFLEAQAMLGGGTVWSVLETAARLCLCNSDMAKQLTVAGYDAEKLLDQLMVTAAAVEAARRVSGCSTLPADTSSMAQQLAALGRVLTTLPLSCACNNPDCSNVSGPTEAALATGKSRMCAGCRRAHYCSRDCLAQHWKQHKPVCKALALLAASKSGPS